MKISSLPDKYQAQVRKQIAKKKSLPQVGVPIVITDKVLRQPITLTMKIPPSVNHLFSEGQTRRIRSPAYQAWRNEVLKDLVFIQQVPSLHGDVALFIEVARSVRGDISNRIKACEDALVHARIIDDDRFVVEVSAKWAEVETCRVRIEPR